MSVYQQYPYNYQYPYYYPQNTSPMATPANSQLQPHLQMNQAQSYQHQYQHPQQLPQGSPQQYGSPVKMVPGQHNLQNMPYGQQVPVPFQVPFYYYNNMNEKKTKLSTTWTQREDKLLRELKEKQKLGWRDISTFFNDRTPNACQFRWRRIISSLNANGSETPIDKKSRSSSISSNSSASSISSITSNHNYMHSHGPNHSHSSSISSASSSPKINKKSHHSINYILN